MAKWFGKASHGMHVMCCIFKDDGGKLVIRTYIVFIGKASQDVGAVYIVFIGKASQDVGAVMAIYETCLRQIRVHAPHIEFLIDKLINAGCYCCFVQNMHFAGDFETTLYEWGSTVMG